MRVQDEKTKTMDGAVSRRKILWAEQHLPRQRRWDQRGLLKRKRSSSVPHPCLLHFLPIRSVKSP